jgi:hypothetical protein
MKYEKTSEKSSTRTSADVVDEILQLLQRHGVVYVNRVLFENQSPTELEALKGRVRAVIDKYNC